VDVHPTTAARVVGWAGLVGHLLVGAFPYAVSGLVAPMLGVALLWAVWVGLLVVAILLLRRRPALTFLVPLSALALWGAIIWLGEALFDWTA
jgi:hypothetical protein